MQIIIELPDMAYHKIKVGEYDYGDMNNIIRNGIPLPKGHGRLIDADALGEKEECYLSEDESIQFFYVYSSDIIYAPTIVEADKEE